MRTVMTGGHSSFVALSPLGFAIDPNGEGTFEVIGTQPCFDLYINLPAHKKVDVMLLSMSDDFSDSEFYHVDHEVIISSADDCERRSSPSGRLFIRQEEKWWLSFPKTPPNGFFRKCNKKIAIVQEMDRLDHQGGQGNQ
ncbi:hypothetical protein PVL29_014611 [Vitis rotundifolia]|uniref:PRONE domain-containing protein n=1 Tax=Vitis rotundifolia TaxID=103349 RepID=A0AA39DM77_VITRO|nr:hypothetical protein PVL29_014611 [Vitis rotundifolia]